MRKPFPPAFLLQRHVSGDALFFAVLWKKEERTGFPVANEGFRERREYFVYGFPGKYRWHGWDFCGYFGKLPAKHRTVPGTGKGIFTWKYGNTETAGPYRTSVFLHRPACIVRECRGCVPDAGGQLGAGAGGMLKLRLFWWRNGSRWILWGDGRRRGGAGRFLLRASG